MKATTGLLLVIGVVLGIAGFPAGRNPSGVLVWTESAMVKIRPHDSPPEAPRREIELFAGRNEFEPFQIVVRADSGPVSGIDVTIEDFVGPDGARVPASSVSIFRVGYVTLSRPSSRSEGGRGEWPDPLWPRVDRLTGEQRSVFPFEAPAGRNQSVWIEVYVPPPTAAGLYESEVVVSMGESELARISVSLTVWNFTLPSTSSLRTAFGFSGVTALTKHFGAYTHDRDLYELTSLYAKSALMHRLSLYGGSMVPPPSSGEAESMEIDWSAYDAELGPFLDGTVLSGDDPLPGAKVTSVDLRTDPGLEGENRLHYWRRWLEHFDERGWTDRLYRYLWDEPYEENYPAVIREGLDSRAAHPNIRNLLTEPYADSLDPVVDIWVPLVNCFARRPDTEHYCEEIVPIEDYGEAVSSGDGLWWYQSCASHGCTGPGGDYFQGWPSYVIDHSPPAHRIMEWLSWAYGFEGELYFATNDAFSKDGPVESSLYMYGGNGDGTLFYPGRPSEIGGTTHIPIESIRLKLIREGLEDYEYMRMLAEAGEEQYVRSEVERIVRDIYDWTNDANLMSQIRRELGIRLDRVGATMNR